MENSKSKTETPKNEPGDFFKSNVQEVGSAYKNNMRDLIMTYCYIAIIQTIAYIVTFYLVIELMICRRR